MGGQIQKRDIQTFMLRHRTGRQQLAHGFVEAGLTGTLALAGVHTGDAVLATLVFRLVSFWLPLPVGLGAFFAFRHRHPATVVAPDASDTDPGGHTRPHGL